MASDQAERGAVRLHHDRPRHRGALWHHARPRSTTRSTTPFGQRIVSTIFTQSNQYRVILQADPALHAIRSSALGTIYLPSATAVGGQVPLSALVEGDRRQTAPLSDRAPRAVPGDHHLRSTSPAARRSGMRWMPSRRPSRAIGLPASMMTTFQGAALAFQSTLGNELLLILAALATVYIVLGVLYESFIHPITILSTLPSAGVGALLALMLFARDLGVIGIIGIILLIGIVKKNAIMMIDFALVAEREQGMSAARCDLPAPRCLRFRPILMTTMAALLGAASDARPRHRLGTAPSARHHHRRRPDRQPAADALYHAGHLPVLRSLRAPRARLGRGEGARRSGGAMNLSEPVHPPPDRDHAAHRRGRLRGHPRLHQAARSRRCRRWTSRPSRCNASMPGASPDIMASTVATPLERHLGQHRRRHRDDLLERRPGSAHVTLQFGLNRDIDGAARDVEAAINAARADLPTSAAQQPDLPQGQPGRRADHDPGAHLGDARPGPASTTPPTRSCRRSCPR